MIISEWAARWGIPRAAVEDLLARLGAYDLTPPDKEGASESAVQSRVRLEGARIGVTLWRNNVGAAYLKDGSFLRYGLANDSQALNAKFKSSDLVGIRPVLITQAHVGRVLGQFVARECKPEGWRFRGSERENAQLRFIEFVTSKGGDACFANGEGTLS